MPVAACWRINLTLRQLAPPSGVSGRRPTGSLTRPRGGELTEWQAGHNREHEQVRVEHVFTRMKTWKILRHCRLKGDGVHHAMLGIARLHNLSQAA